MSNQEVEIHSPDHGQGGHHHRGPSSFWMHDPRLVFGEIGLKRGESFLDLGSGPGDYALYAARIIGDSGMVYAVDRGEEMIANLMKKANFQGLENIIGIISDITTDLPLKDRCVDVCFIATVLHVPEVNKAMPSLLSEVRRVLKPSGRLVIIECKKEETAFGPPLKMRLSAEEIEGVATPGGFVKIGDTDLGFNYMVQFRPSAVGESGSQ